MLACWREVIVLESTTTVSIDKSSYSQISQCWEVMTIAGIWQVARSHFNSSKTSNPVRSGIITPLKNCAQLLKKQPIAIFQLSWLPRSQYNEFVFTSFSANTEKLSSSSPIKTFAAESGADEGEFAIASGISSPLAADFSKEFS